MFKAEEVKKENKKEVCSACSGSGTDETGDKSCPECKGAGVK